MRHLEIVFIRILGALLILLGLTLYLSPRVAYTTHQRIRNSPYRVQREKNLLVPRPVSVLLVAGGFFTLFLVRKTR